MPSKPYFTMPIDKVVGLSELRTREITPNAFLGKKHAFLSTGREKCYANITDSELRARFT
jgi:hypothetical protein